MKYFSLGDGGMHEYEGKFYEFINENNGDDWTITVSSGGGQVYFAKAASQIVRAHIDSGHKVVFIVNAAYSSAFWLIWWCKDIAEFIFDLDGRVMHHYTTITLKIDSRLKPVYDEDVHIKKELVTTGRKALNKIARQIFSKKKYKKFKKGMDVFICNREVMKHFPKSKLI